MLSKLTFWRATCALAVVALLATACGAPATPQVTAPPEKFVFGLVMVGPKEDHGWNQAHWEAAQEVLAAIPNSELVWLDKVNQADRPGTTIEQIADDFADKGAKVIFTNSAEFKDPTTSAAKAHPDITFIHISGDGALDGSAPQNMGNFMGRMEYGKMIAGCAAALTTEKGNIAYLGPLIDSETRRLVNSAFLGARYCWEKVLGKDPAELKFTVTWIGFWLNIPGVTLDPTQVANDFFNNGADVIISGIDTTEGLVVAGQRAAQGEKVWAIPYDYTGSCAEAEQICLGVPFFNWGPAYIKTIQQVQQGIWEQKWEWLGPDWATISDPATDGAVGWVDGQALSAANKEHLQTFIKGLGDGSIDLYMGPLKFQDGTDFLLPEEKATDRQIWYTPQLLEGIEGKSQ